MEIEIEISNIERVKKAREALNKIDSMNLSKNIKMEFTEENLKKAKEIKEICNEGWIRTDIKIVNSDGVELTQII